LSISQRASILSKFILNKNPKKRKATTPDLDSSESYG
jgi:hypothetical protein